MIELGAPRVLSCPKKGDEEVSENSKETERQTDERHNDRPRTIVRENEGDRRDHGNERCSHARKPAREAARGGAMRGLL